MRVDNSDININADETKDYAFAFLGEFGYELISWLPYLKYLKETFNIKLNTISRPGSSLFYNFSDAHYEVSSDYIGDMWGDEYCYAKLYNKFQQYKIIHPGQDFINKRNIKIENTNWENKDIHTIIKTNNYSILNLDYVKIVPDIIKKPFVVINNKFQRQWFNKYKSPINYFNDIELKEIISLLNKKGINVIYNNFIEKTNYDIIYNHEFKLDNENNINLWDNFTGINEIQKNEIQINLYNDAEYIIGVQGGNMYLPLILGKKCLILMRDGNYIDYLELARIYNAEVQCFYESSQIINSIELNNKFNTIETIQKFHYAKK